MATTTRELWSAWRERQDEAAFEALVRPELPAAYDLARRMGFARADAEDAVQDVLLALARNRSARPADVGVGAWLMRAVRLRALTNARSQRRRLRTRSRPRPTSRRKSSGPSPRRSAAWAVRDA